MKKQKICIVGDGLTGLTTALILSKLGIDIDLISKKNKTTKFVDNRTTAISEDNYFFLSKYLSNIDLKSFWPCQRIDLYYEKSNRYHHFMDFQNNGKNLMYIVENKKLRKIIFTIIRKEKNIKIINKKITNISINESAIFTGNKKSIYDLIILCLGKGSNIVSKLIGKRTIEENLGETAFTSLVKHKLNISDARQYFLEEGPLAILPISKKQFSFVWSLNKKQNINEIKNLVHLKLKKILNTRRKIVLNNFSSFPISFKFNINFFKRNFLVLGEGLYNIQPVAGQGFNLILRDIRELYRQIEKHFSLGLQIKDSLIFKKFMLSRKPENLFFGLGINFTNRFFKHNRSTSLFKEIILKDINKFKLLKDLSLKISNKGIF
tara:strand:- start:5275 stop:6408 length:1134 start_codon:yes stop_codon:yes gene_type:complete